MSQEELERTQLIGDLQRANYRLTESQKFMLQLVAAIITEAGGKIVLGVEAQRHVALSPDTISIITTQIPEDGTMHVTVRKTPKNP